MNGVSSTNYVLVIHGGSCDFEEQKIPERNRQLMVASLKTAFKEGNKVLAEGGSSLDAVQRVVHLLENCGYFNAGKGACLAQDGICELDAAIMSGHPQKGGSVIGTTRIKNPIDAARKVQESAYGMFTGKGAEDFAESQSIKLVSNEYFKTTWAIEDWEEEKKIFESANFSKAGKALPKKYGTVGAVALDQQGNLAAATSTGGYTYKPNGRVGDSPILGGGTFATKHCAVSCTGDGEFLMNHAIGAKVAHKLKYTKKPLDALLKEIINKTFKNNGAKGGVIAIDRSGKIGINFNTNIMFCCFINSNGHLVVKIGKDLEY